MRHCSTTRARLLAEVPAFRPVAVQLLKIVDQPDVPFARIVSLLRTDAALSTEMLRIANSPLFFRGSEIRSILHALSILGLTRVKALVVTTSMRSTVDPQRSTLALPAWRHSLSTAILCEHIAPFVGLQRDNCYTAGLVHDIGRLALLRAFPEYESAMCAAAAAGADLLEKERLLFGMDHAEAGRWLLGQWGCPIEFQNVAAFHEKASPGQGRDGTLIALVHAASRMADFIGMAVFDTGRRPELPEVAAALPARATEQVLNRFSEIINRTLADVNGVEMNLELTV